MAEVGSRVPHAAGSRWERIQHEDHWELYDLSQVLPLDDRFQVRALGREALYAGREQMVFYEGSVRIQPFEAPQTLNRSWELSAELDVGWDKGTPVSEEYGPIARSSSRSASPLSAFMG